MSLNEKFNTAAEQVRKFTKKPPDSDMLELYALYKQATVGDVNIPKPSDQAGKAKWDAWSGKKGLSTTTAKEQYVAKAQALSGKFS